MVTSLRTLVEWTRSLFIAAPEEPPPPPSPTFSEEWRKINWGDEESLQCVRDYKPVTDDIKLLRVLLYGPVGAGKSSFINSVVSTIRGRMSVPAAANATTAGRSFTTKYETHHIKIGKGNQGTYPIIFNDIMGLEEGDTQGVRPADIKLTMEGHVKEGYMFNAAGPLSDANPGYNKSPSLDDRVHVLVCVVSANSAEITDSVLRKMAKVREMARDLGIPQMMIITKIDEACPETEKTLRNVYMSKYVKQKMKDFSSAVGIPMNCIFPVKNYSDEIEMKDDVDILILSALRKMIDFGDDFIDKIKEKEEEK
ncbi:interferon-induced protein 44-like isoform X1 [Epinephelus fuscoguttatus]|uniref:interferon-induced protein 44-like isoform X1 n=2 Tax=Epinephelus fuscoguttatus TaxID=293821 RepID=UPI0020D16CFA|nr:interferon-induced protein 44-like isoform X1 [Epinephelus fuscoguttatus]